MLAWVKKLTEKVIGPPSFKIGDIVRHPSGRMVQITDGQFWGEFGLSNFWYWQEVLPDGKLSATIEKGYGW